MAVPVIAVMEFAIFQPMRVLPGISLAPAILRSIKRVANSPVKGPMLYQLIRDYQIIPFAPRIW